MTEDLLKLMFRMQKKFQDKYGFYIPIAFIANAISAEASELWAGAGGKWWKAYLKEFNCKRTWGDILRTERDIFTFLYSVENKNKDNIKEELADILHFWLQACLAIGLTPEEIFDIYSAKLAENYRRQKRRY